MERNEGQGENTTGKWRFMKQHRKELGEAWCFQVDRGPEEEEEEEIAK